MSRYRPPRTLPISAMCRHPYSSRCAGVLAGRLAQPMVRSRDRRAPPEVLTMDPDRGTAPDSPAPPSADRTPHWGPAAAPVTPTANTTGLSPQDAPRVTPSADRTRRSDAVADEVSGHSGTPGGTSQRRGVLSGQSGSPTKMGPRRGLLFGLSVTIFGVRRPRSSVRCPPTGVASSGCVGRRTPTADDARAAFRARDSAGAPAAPDPDRSARGRAPRTPSASRPASLRRSADPRTHRRRPPAPP